MTENTMDIWWSAYLAVLAATGVPSTARTRADEAERHYWEKKDRTKCG